MDDIGHVLVVGRLAHAIPGHPGPGHRSAGPGDVETANRHEHQTTMATAAGPRWVNVSRKRHSQCISSWLSTGIMACAHTSAHPGIGQGDGTRIRLVKISTSTPILAVMARSWITWIWMIISTGETDTVREQRGDTRQEQAAESIARRHIGHSTAADILDDTVQFLGAVTHPGWQTPGRAPGWKRTQFIAQGRQDTQLPDHRYQGTANDHERGAKALGIHVQQDNGDHHRYAKKAITENRPSIRSPISLAKPMM